MLKSHTATDPMTGRKSSRLSNFYSMKGKIPLPIKNENINVHLNQYNQFAPPSKVSVDGGLSLSPSNTHTPTLHKIASNNSTYYYGAGHHDQHTNDNYRLVRMDTNHSLDSDYSVQSQYRVTLDLNKKEVEMIRYTWNVMLIDEVVVQQKSRLPIPGGFPLGGSKEKTAPASKLTASSMASSLFCRQFYGNLLHKDPDLERLFPSIKHQAVAFAGVMTFAISQLENLTVLDEYLMKLGKRHSRILNIEPAQFELMGEALIETFYERFGKLFNQELEILWIKLYLYLSNSILQFGLDPVLRLQDDPMNSTYSIDEDGKSTRSLSQSYSEYSYDFTGKRFSVSTGVTSHGTSDSASLGYQKGAPPKRPVTNDLNTKKQGGYGLPPLPAMSGSSIGGKANVSKLIKRKKKDCVIM